MENSVSSSQDLLSNFWKERPNRKAFFKVTDLQRKQMNIQSRLWFLRCCLCLGVCPVTLEVNKRHPGLTDDLNDKWMELQSQSEEKFLGLAKEQIEKEASDCRTKVRRATMDLEDSLSDDLWHVVETQLEKSRVRAWKAANNCHRLKLKHLLVKSSKAIPSWLNRSAQTKIQFTSLFLSESEESSSSSSSTSLFASPGPALHSTPARPAPAPRTVPQPMARPPVPAPGERVDLEELDLWLQSQRDNARQENDLNNNDPAVDQPPLPRRRKKRRNRRFMNRTKFRNRARRFNRRRIDNVLFTNYSNYVLSEYQKKYLNLGLNFCPRRNKVNKTEVVASFLRWERVMRWIEFWHRMKEKKSLDTIAEEDEEEEEESEKHEDRIFKDDQIKTNLPRKHNPRAALTECIAGTKSGIFGAPLNESQPNIPIMVNAAGEDLVTLQRDRILAIKPSDKTGGVCILPFDSYKKVMDDKLKETFVAPDGSIKPKYTKATAKNLSEQHQKIADLVEEGVSRGFITPEDAALMVPDCPTPGRLYGLVKDHKPVNPDTGIPPLREVISGCGSNTEKISAYVDHHCKKYKTSLETFLEDTPHVLRVIAEQNRAGPLPPGSIPVTADVVGLFPNTPHEGGLRALREALEADTDLKPGHGDFIARLMEAILTCNTFEWDEELFTQEDGCAIGTRAAPTYCGIFMGRLIREAKRKWFLQNIRVEHRPKNLKLFEDDFLFFWTGGKIKLLEFLHFLNSQDPAIKITWEFDFVTRSVFYLDMRIWVDEDGYVQTDLYVKPNTKNNYLLASSSHPSHIFRNIPYSLAHRLVRNCSQRETLELRLSELMELLLVRGYRKNIIAAAFDKARALDRSEALKKVVREKSEARRPTFVTTFDPRLPQFSKILHQNWKVMVETDTRMLDVFPKPPMVCYKRPPNIKDILCRARLPPKRRATATRRTKPGFRRCQKQKTCRLCPYTHLSPGEIKDSVTFDHSGEVIPIKSIIDCQTSNIIYKLDCLKCPIPYLGESGQTAEQRLVGHINSINLDCYNNTKLPVGRHFRDSPGHDHSDLRFMPFEKIKSRNPFIRKARERHFINKHQLLVHGLNLRL